MAISSKDIETLWNQYSEEGCKNGTSVAQYFESNGVPYRTFEKWYKKKFSMPEVVTCMVTGVPNPSPRASVEEKKDASPEVPEKGKKQSASVSYINIGLSNGVKIEHHRLSYSDLVSFIEKLQPLCSA